LTLDARHDHVMGVWSTSHARVSPLQEVSHV
jgi:hypothetical protein